MLLIVVYLGHDVIGCEDLAHWKNDTIDEEGDKSFETKCPIDHSRKYHNIP